MAKAWYFSKDDCRLRYGDNRLIEAGTTHTVKGDPELCSHGLHASERIIDALGYAPGNYIWFVNISHKIDKGNDKLCGQRREYYWGFDASDVLRAFARKQALINIEKAKPYFKSVHDYDLIIEFLTTGKEDLRSAAWSAAESAAWSAAWSAAESAARSAAWSAAWSAAESAAWSAAESAAWSAADKMLESMIIEEAKRLGVYN